MRGVTVKELKGTQPYIFKKDLNTKGGSKRIMEWWKDEGGLIKKLVRRWR